MAEIKRKRVTLHPLRKDGQMDTTVNLYPKCFLDGIVDREGNEVSVATASDLAGKQDVIEDLDTIRTNAAAASTAVQPADLSSVQAALEAEIQAVPQGDVTTAQLEAAVAGKQDVIEDLSDIRTYASNAEQVTVIEMNIDDFWCGIDNYNNDSQSFGWLYQILGWDQHPYGDVAADHTIPFEFASMDNEELVKQKVIWVDSNYEYRPLVLSNFYIFDTPDPHSDRPQHIQCDIEGMQPWVPGLYSGYFHGMLNYCCNYGTITGSYVDWEYGVCKVDYNEIE